MNNNIYKNNNKNIDEKTWNFDDVSDTSDSQSACSTDNSEDSLIKLTGSNVINSNP